MKLTLLLLGILSAASAADVDIYTTKDFREMEQKLEKKGAPFASQDLEKYGNHYTMLALREATGSAEVHEREADIFVIETGEAVIQTGGTLINPRKQKPGELRGTGITGGEKHTLAAGDVIHIPAGVPHQLLIQKGQPFSYFVVKVTDQ